ncbi:MAG: single-stranded-DNA-specific exonuclease RecJ [Pseudohongiellaceae bacterium]|nr:single-stranded-DNA-specific exonuclease RecJ [Pseudohongiellaceae bacterium]
MQVVRREQKQQGRFSASIPPILSRIYAARNVFSDDEIALDLKSLHPPSLLKGLPEAVQLLMQALENRSRILIVSDFDADGATSCALMMRALASMGFPHVDYIVPNRFEYGYGLMPEIVALAAKKKPDLIITVDNGISSIEGVLAANELGMQVLVTDHHLPGHALPEAAAIVNPNQPECPFPSKALAGVGVVFYLMIALRSSLREQQWFEKQGIREPNLANFLDIVALGTVADVVPLDRNNRILVSEGIKRIRAGRACAGINALLRLGKRNPARLVASDLGFAVGPRLNAAGRLDDMSLGIECLLIDDERSAMTMAMELDSMNQERKQIEADMKEQAMRDLEALSLSESSTPSGLCLYNANWHQGVIGILASRLKERFHKPVIVFADAGVNSDGEAELKGSARSIAGLHIRDVLDSVATHNPGLVSRFGGHAMAAGLSLLKSDFDAFNEAFAAEVAAQLGEGAQAASILSDGEMAAEQLSLPTAQCLREGGPWGQGFPEPCFDGRFQVLQQRVLAGAHLKLVLCPVGQSQHAVDAIAFNVDLEQWPGEQVDSIDIVYKLDVNEYRGKQSLQLIIEQISPV